jgi:hypothetical protein
MIKPTLDRIHELNHSDLDSLPDETEDNAYQVVQFFTGVDIDGMHFSYKDVLYSIAKSTYIKISNKPLNECSIDTWAALLMLAIDEIATEENNKKVAKDALSGTQKVLRMHPEKLDENIKVWLEDMFKGVYLF